MKMRVSLIALGIVCVATAQDSGVVGNKITQSVICRYPTGGIYGLAPKPTVLASPAPKTTVEAGLAPNPNVIWVNAVLLARDLPVPATGNLNTTASITKSQAIQLGVDPSVIQDIENSLDPGFTISQIRYTVTTRGSYVGKFRKTCATITQGTDTNLNDWDYSRYVGEKLQSFGWNWGARPAYIDSSAFTGIDCVVNNSGSDIVFYAGHSYADGAGPSVPGSEDDLNFVKNFKWGYSSGPNRGARWVFAQTCEWFRPEYEHPGPNLPANGNGRWSSAFMSGNGSLHGIFGYSSEAWLIDRWTVGHYPGFHSTNLAPVAALSNMNQYGGGLGDSWFLGSRNQTQYQYGGGPGAIPAVMTISNSKCRDYFYETFNGTVDSPGMYPDPIDVPDPGAMLVFHYQYIVSAMNGNPPWF